MCFIVISVKNCRGIELIGEDFLPREAVEGVWLQKVEKKRKIIDESNAKDTEWKTVEIDDRGCRVRKESDVDVKDDGGKETVKTEISPISKHLNLGLTLNSEVHQSGGHPR